MLAKSGVEQLDKILQNRLNSEKVNRGEKKHTFFFRWTFRFKTEFFKYEATQWRKRLCVPRQWTNINVPHTLASATLEFALGKHTDNPCPIFKKIWRDSWHLHMQCLCATDTIKCNDTSVCWTLSALFQASTRTAMAGNHQMGFASLPGHVWQQAFYLNQ